MEILIAIGGGIVVLALFGGGAYFYDKVYLTRTMRAQIIDALDTTERIGISDMNSNVSEVAKRWRLIGVGISESKSYDLESHVPRMEAAINVMKPVEDKLRKQIFEEGIPIRLRTFQ